MSERPIEEAQVLAMRDSPREYGEGHVRALCNSWLAQRCVVDAARDPFLVILESHPDAEPHVNADMKRAADNFRAALKDSE